MKNQKAFFILTVFLPYFAYFGRGSHLLDKGRATGRYINIQDQVLESCRGHFMCEVFPYFNSHGIVCLNISLVCDGVAHCRDGSDEIPSICQGLRESTTDPHLSAESPQTVHLNPSPILNGNALEFYDANTYTNVTTNDYATVDGNPVSGDTQVAYNAAQYSKSEVTTVPSPKTGTYVYHSEYHELPTTRLQLDTMKQEGSLTKQHKQGDSILPKLSQSLFGTSNNRLAKRLGILPPQLSSTSLGLNLKPLGQRPLFPRFSKFLGMRQPFANGLDMWFQGTPMDKIFALADAYYKNRKSVDNNASLPAGPLRTTKFKNIHVPTTGSSYQDSPVLTPPPVVTPDGIIHAPGEEPHLLQEQNFLEQQFYLTNTLDGSQGTQQVNDLTTEQGPETEQIRISKEMLIGQKRQEQLLRQQIVGWNVHPERTDPSYAQRYGVSGPFDGGFPTDPGELKNLNSMEVTEAQNAIHSLEAVH